jgi:hypothetical protein
LFGAYIKKYEPFGKVTPFKAFLGYAVCVIITWGATVFSDTVLSGTPLEVYCGAMLTYTSPSVLGAGFFLFMLFKQINVSSQAAKKVIGLFSATSFSVYIIHSHPLVWEHLIKCRFSSVSDMSFAATITVSIGIALGIYLFCSVIDLPRHFLFAALKLKNRLLKLEGKMTENADR